MTLFSNELFADLLSAHQPPCLSLYQPTHRRRPENQQDPIRFRNLVKAIEGSLRQKYPAREVQPLLEPFQVLAEDRDFWNHTLDGLAVLGAPGMFRASNSSGRSPSWLSWPTAFTPSPSCASFSRPTATTSLV